MEGNLPDSFFVGWKFLHRRSIRYRWLFNVGASSSSVQYWNDVLCVLDDPAFLGRFDDRRLRCQHSKR